MSGILLEHVFLPHVLPEMQLMVINVDKIQGQRLHKDTQSPVVLINSLLLHHPIKVCNRTNPTQVKEWIITQ